MRLIELTVNCIEMNSSKLKGKQTRGRHDKGRRRGKISKTTFEQTIKKNKGVAHIVRLTVATGNLHNVHMQIKQDTQLSFKNSGHSISL